MIPYKIRFVWRRLWLCSIAAVLPGVPVCGLSAADVPETSVSIIVDRSETRRICQVTGEIDRTTGKPTSNMTETRFRFWGTDLGTSFEHDGQLVMLFGDTHAVPGLDRPRDSNIIGFSTTIDPENCLALSFPTDEDGGYRPMEIPGLQAAPFSVPTAGFSANGALYVVVTADHAASSPMARSVLASSRDRGRSFSVHYDLSNNHFINVAAAQVAAGDVAGLPPGMGNAVLLWGSGQFRRSSARLALLPTAQVEHRDTLRYFAGLHPVTADPVWSVREEDSVALFDEHCIGEISVAWNRYIRKWVMLYNCGHPRSKILIRTAAMPWGPWSTSQVLFDPVTDNGYYHFMQGPAEMEGRTEPVTSYRTVSDPHTPAVVGEAYGPYQVGRFARGIAGSYTDIYFVMSTWNPYNVVLMGVKLRLRNFHQARIAPFPVDATLLPCVQGLHCRHAPCAETTESAGGCHGL